MSHPFRESGFSLQKGNDINMERSPGMFGFPSSCPLPLKLCPLLAP